MTLIDLLSRIGSWLAPDWAAPYPEDDPLAC
jgi:hypothetical protein